MHLAPPIPAGPPEAVLPLAALFLAIAGQYVASYYLGRRALVIATLILLTTLAWWGDARVALIFEAGKQRRPGAGMEGIAAYYVVLLCIAVGLILILSAAIIGWRHRKYR